MRRFKREVDFGADRLMVATVLHVHPDELKGWTVLGVLNTGQGKVQSTACCLHHAGVDVAEVFCPVLAEFPPCPGES